MKKLILITFLAAGVLVLGTTAVKADETRDYPPIVQKLVERFGLNEDEVKAVFDENRTERKEERQAKHDEKLDQAVSDGVITEEQKQALEAKREEMKPDKGEFRDLSKEEREVQREAHRGEMESWAEGQGIDLEALHQFMGPKKGPGRRRPGRSR